MQGLPTLKKRNNKYYKLSLFGLGKDTLLIAVLFNLIIDDREGYTKIRNGKQPCSCRISSSFLSLYVNV